MQRGESCSTSILTTEVLPTLKKTSRPPQFYIRVILCRTCFGTDADLTAALRKSLPADSPSATIVTAFVVIFRRKSGARNAGERERAHFTTRWRRRKSPHLELLLLPRLLQICPRPLRGGHVRQGGTGRRHEDEEGRRKTE